MAPQIAYNKHAKAPPSIYSHILRPKAWPFLNQKGLCTPYN